MLTRSHTCVEGRRSEIPFWQANISNSLSWLLAPPCVCIFCLQKHKGRNCHKGSSVLFSDRCSIGLPAPGESWLELLDLPTCNTSTCKPQSIDQLQCFNWVSQKAFILKVNTVFSNQKGEWEQKGLHRVYFEVIHLEMHLPFLPKQLIASAGWTDAVWV